MATENTDVRDMRIIHHHLGEAHTLERPHHPQGLHRPSIHHHQSQVFKPDLPRPMSILKNFLKKMCIKSIPALPSFNGHTMSLAMSKLSLMASIPHESSPVTPEAPPTKLSDHAGSSVSLPKSRVRSLTMSYRDLPP